MKPSPLDVVLVSVFLAAAIIGCILKVFTPAIVSAIVTGALAFLAMRVKVLAGKPDDAKPKPLDDGVPQEKLEGHHSHRLLIGENGSVKVEDVDPAADTEKAVGKPK